MYSYEELQNKIQGFIIVIIYYRYYYCVCVTQDN